MSAKYWFENLLSISLQVPKSSDAQVPDSGLFVQNRCISSCVNQLIFGLNTNKHCNEHCYATLFQAKLLNLGL